jgi:hypothetical protein
VGAAGMSDAELAEAKRYGRLKLACALAEKAVDLAYLTAAAFWFAQPLDVWLQKGPLLASCWSLRLAALLLLLLAPIQAKALGVFEADLSDEWERSESGAAAWRA